MGSLVGLYNQFWSGKTTGLFPWQTGATCGTPGLGRGIGCVSQLLLILWVSSYIPLTECVTGWTLYSERATDRVSQSDRALGCALLLGDATGFAPKLGRIAGWASWSDWLLAFIYWYKNSLGRVTGQKWLPVISHCWVGYKLLWSQVGYRLGFMAKWYHGWALRVPGITVWVSLLCIPRGYTW